MIERTLWILLHPVHISEITKHRANQVKDEIEINTEIFPSSGYGFFVYLQTDISHWGTGFVCHI